MPADAANLDSPPGIERPADMRILGAVLRALRDFMGVDEAVEFARRLPSDLLPAYFEGWAPSGTAPGPMTRESFIARVAASLGTSPAEAHAAVAHALRFLKHATDTARPREGRVPLSPALHGLTV